MRQDFVMSVYLTLTSGFNARAMKKKKDRLATSEWVLITSVSVYYDVKKGEEQKVKLIDNV